MLGEPGGTAKWLSSGMTVTICHASLDKISIRPHCELAPKISDRLLRAGSAPEIKTGQEEQYMK